MVMKKDFTNQATTTIVVKKKAVIATTMIATVTKTVAIATMMNKK